MRNELSLGYFQRFWQTSSSFRKECAANKCGFDNIATGRFIGVFRNLSNILYKAFFFFYQNDLHVLLTKQLYKINCEIIKVKLIEKKHIIKRGQNIYKTLATSFGC